MPSKFASNHKVSSFFSELWFSQNFYFSFANCYAFADDCTVNHHDEKMPGLEGGQWDGGTVGGKYLLFKNSSHTLVSL